LGEQPANQYQPRRVRRYNAGIETLASAINATCNPFYTGSPLELVNVASEKSTLEDTKDYLLSTLEQGADL
ncbi:hypothetical protein SK128_000104, partial [Halocaridina rubra]